MKVSELKELLANVPDDAVVILHSDEEDEYYWAKEVETGYVRYVEYNNGVKGDWFDTRFGFLELTPEQQKKYHIKEYQILDAVEIS